MDNYRMERLNDVSRYAVGFTEKLPDDTTRISTVTVAAEEIGDALKRVSDIINAACMDDVIMITLTKELKA